MRALPLLLVVLLAGSLSGQDAKFPLDSVRVEGSSVPRAVVMEIASLEIGMPVNKASIEDACKKLGETGIFESAAYLYGPVPNGGYTVTLTLADERAPIPASIDIPGVDGEEVWRWLISRFPVLDHKIPDLGTAQQFVAQQIEGHLNDLHLSDRLRGRHLTARMESNLSSGGSLLSFQPETLPAIASISFVGQHEITAEELAGILKKAIGDQGYLERVFRALVELNLRRAYEARGMYRVKFPSITIQPVGAASVSVTTTIEEGPKYVLGDVQVVGSDLPVEAMLAAAGFKKGKPANWTEIQNGLWAMEGPVKRTGYLNAAAKPERVFDDERHILSLRVSVNKGPLYRFGQVQFLGLSPELKEKAYSIWQLQTGKPYDYLYSNDFLKAFSKAADLRQFKKITPFQHAGFGDHVMDLTLSFQ
jgi:outer membrane protein assembly factor BamA